MFVKSCEVLRDNADVDRHTIINIVRLALAHPFIAILPERLWIIGALPLSGHNNSSPTK